MGIWIGVFGVSLAAEVLGCLLVFRAAMEMLANMISKAIREAPQTRIAPQAMYYRDDIIIFDWESGVILSSRDAGETWVYVTRIERRWFQ